MKPWPSPEQDAAASDGSVIAELEKDREAMASQLESARARITEMENMLNSATISNAELQNELDRAREEVTNLSEMKEQTERLKHDLESHISTLESQLEDEATKSIDVSEQLEIAIEQNKVSENTVHEFKLELQALQLELETARQKEAEARSSLDSKKHEVSQLNDEIERLGRDLGHTKQHSDRLEEDLRTQLTQASVISDASGPVNIETLKHDIKQLEWALAASMAELEAMKMTPCGAHCCRFAIGRTQKRSPPRMLR
jgi:chromosome segregation protein